MSTVEKLAPKAETPETAGATDLEREVAAASNVSIIDEDIERAKQLIGAATANNERQYVTCATEDAIRNFAVGYGDDNALFTDPDYAATSCWGGQIAPSIM